MRFEFRTFLIALFACHALACFGQTASSQPTSAVPLPESKAKLIEMGWDIPDPDFIRKNIREMEKSPFDGVAIRLRNHGSSVFQPNHWDPQILQPQLKELADIQWDKFTDNFLMLYASSSMDWVSEEDWTKILQQTKFCAKAAKAARCKGFMFDPEPYAGNPWKYADQKHAKEMSYDAYVKLVRQRGRQFMDAITSEMPDAKMLLLYQNSIFQPFSQGANVSWPNLNRQSYDGTVNRNMLGPITNETRQRVFREHYYGLYSAFLEGMLEAATPGIQFIEGNERSYYYTKPEQFFRAYYWTRHDSADWVDPALRQKYLAQSRSAQAVYLDFLLNTTPPTFRANMLNPAVSMTPDERLAWLERITSYALTATDEYVWFYSEKFSWWKPDDKNPPVAKAVQAARQAVAAGEINGYSEQTKPLATHAFSRAMPFGNVFKMLNKADPKLAVVQRDDDVLFAYSTSTYLYGTNSQNPAAARVFSVAANPVKITADVLFQSPGSSLGVYLIDPSDNTKAYLMLFDVDSAGANDQFRFAIDGNPVTAEGGKLTSGDYLNNTDCGVATGRPATISFTYGVGINNHPIMTLSAGCDTRTITFRDIQTPLREFKLGLRVFPAKSEPQAGVVLKKITIEELVR